MKVEKENEKRERAANGSNDDVVVGEGKPRYERDKKRAVLGGAGRGRDDEEGEENGVVEASRRLDR